jgi:hypothetical protein
MLVDVMSLAPTPPANEFVRPEAHDMPQARFPLTLLLCGDCGHLQLAEIVDPRRLFENYVYVSGTSAVFVAHFERLAKTCRERFGLDASSLVVDIGSNDGTLLKQFQALGLSKILGVDPAIQIAKEARAAGVPTLEGFFTPALAEEMRREHGPAALVTANNVFAHAEDLAGFTRGVSALLDAQGVFVFEVSYLVDVVEKLLFDTIYHEHLAYHAVGPLVSFFDRLGLRLFDAERVESHGGSIRCFVTHKGASHGNTARRDELLAHEREIGLFRPDTYARFKSRISARGAELRGNLAAARAQGHRIAGFGAPAKLTTLMYEFGLEQRDFVFIVDDSPWKQGLLTPGLHIPVVPSSALADKMPERCVIFAWNFADAIIAKHTAYLKGGGRFVVPLPELREIG